MFCLKIIVLLGFAGTLKLSAAAPDSAGIVEMVNGLAYGGIPYGSVTGMLAKYPGFMTEQTSLPYTRQVNILQNSQPVVITPNLKAVELVGRQYEPVQIYNLPGVVAPGVLSTITQIGY